MPTLSVAASAEIATVRELEVDGMLKLVTEGGVVSAVTIVTVTDALLPVETLFAASLAYAYSVLAPALAKV